MIDLPSQYIAQMKKMLGNEYPAYVSSLEHPIRSGIRINRRKLSAQTWEKIAPFPISRIPWIDNGYMYDDDYKPSLHPYYYAGLYYLQEASAMTPANRLPVQEGDRVLDLCAAPGGKATELGAKCGENGMLLANDISASRCRGLLKNLEMAGVGNCYVTSETPERLATYFPEYFDKILVDAPCSGEGMFAKEPPMIRHWEEYGPSYYQPIQLSILQQALLMLRPGGFLMYSTCTFSIQENELVIKQILEQNPDITIHPIEPIEGFSEGYLGFSDCVRIFPHKMQGAGHFLALLKKKGSIEEKQFSECEQEILKRDDKRYRLPCGTTPIRGLRYLRTGLYLGDETQYGFIPSQAYAMTCDEVSKDDSLALTVEDSRVIRYLKGETINVDDGLKGRYLVRVDGFPLGYGIASGGRLKNKYCAAWRMQL